MWLGDTCGCDEILVGGYLSIWVWWDHPVDMQWCSKIDFLFWVLEIWWDDRQNEGVEMTLNCAGGVLGF